MPSLNVQELGEAHPETAVTLGNLAATIVNQGKYSQAESLYRRLIEDLEKTKGTDDEPKGMVAVLRGLFQCLQVRGC